MAGRSIVRIRYDGEFVAMGVYETLSTTAELYNMLGILLKNMKSIKKLYPRRIRVQAVKLLETLGLGVKSEEREPLETKESITLKKENAQFGYITLVPDLSKRRRSLSIEIDLKDSRFAFNAFKPCTAAQAEQLGYTQDKIAAPGINLECMYPDDYSKLGKCVHAIFKADNRTGILMPVVK